MLAHHVSESELARSLNTSVMTVRRIMSGETADPRISTLKLIADYFNISIDALLDNHAQPLIHGMRKNTSKIIPVLNWSMVCNMDSIDDINLTEWNDWYPIMSGEQSVINAHTFALKSRPSMQPRFFTDTLLVINPDEKPIDGDVILVKMGIENEVSLRLLAIDPPKWQLQPIVSGSETIFYDKSKHTIMGTVVLSLLHTRKSVGL
ncbi:MAG: hypothetical protein A3F46_04150 [Legionellales bacterium RIFCSPHIGHO2_12_FULL_42_9]|nr:MAG: hypothetical protein A3F46_04150 [Legionellales bacterium RIFCSPHIGHO2_12_FULL_42_9]